MSRDDDDPHMDLRRRLGENLLAEGRAYGYTLTIWGAGAMLIREYGLPDHVDVFAYVVGALLAVGALAAAAFGNVLRSNVERDGHERPAVSLVHVAATLGNLLVSYVVIEFVAASTVAWVGFGLVGFQTTATYNVLLLVEERLGYALD